MENILIGKKVRYEKDLTGTIVCMGVKEYQLDDNAGASTTSFIIQRHNSNRIDNVYVEVAEIIEDYDG